MLSTLAGGMTRTGRTERTTRVPAKLRRDSAAVRYELRSSIRNLQWEMCWWVGHRDGRMLAWHVKMPTRSRPQGRQAQPDDRGHFPNTTHNKNIGPCRQICFQVVESNRGALHASIRSKFILFQTHQCGATDLFHR